MDYQSMSLKEKVLQTFVVTIREVNKHGGPEKFFTEYPVGGIYYNKSGVPEDFFTEYQVADMDDNKSADFEMELKIETGTGSCLKRLEQCKRASKHPLLVCADEALIPGQEQALSLGAAAAARSEEDAYMIGTIRGMQMNANGIDWILQPMTDLHYDRISPFGGLTNDAQLNARIYSKIVQGIQDQGICATVKHFPGLGTTNVNMHFAPGKNNLDFEEWMRTYGYYYKEIFKTGVCSVMTTHVTLPSFDSEGENGFYPIATYSTKLTTELLKETLGFQGAVVTDALVMGGMATGDLIGETVQAFRAGADLLLWPPVEAADRIVELLETGEIPMERLEDALRRIEKMRRFREEAQQREVAVPDAKWADRMAREIAEHGICCRKNENKLLPIGQKYKKILVIDATDDKDMNSSELLTRELEMRGFQAEMKRDIYDTDSGVCWQDDIDLLQAQYDLVIFNVNVALQGNWDAANMLIWASHLFDKKKKIIINWSNGYVSMDYFPEDPVIIEANSAPTSHMTKALVNRIVGETEFTGQIRIAEGVR